MSFCRPRITGITFKARKFSLKVKDKNVSYNLGTEYGAVIVSYPNVIIFIYYLWLVSYVSSNGAASE